MRWFWIDRFTEFVKGRRARAVKAVTLAEEQLHDHFPGAAVMPATLVLEGMAQTAGLLVADALEFERQVVLAKVGGARFEFEAAPGDTIEFLADVVELTADGSVVRVTTRIGGRAHASADLYYGHIEAGTMVPRLFKNDEMMRWLDALRIFDVAVHEDGTPVKRGSGPKETPTLRAPPAAPRSTRAGC
jgi:3-hydroxyacyl-[acyl-carrier-protein] dehydratase